MTQRDTQTLITKHTATMMKKVKTMTKGTTEYVKATVDIYFEKDHISCSLCPLLETYSRNQCRRTGEYIVDTRYTVGRWCPLQIQEGEENGIL